MRARRSRIGKMEHVRRRAGELAEVGDEVRLIVVAVPRRGLRPWGAGVPLLDHAAESHHAREGLRRDADVMEELPREMLPRDPDLARDRLHPRHARGDLFDRGIDTRVAIRTKAADQLRLERGDT